MVDIEQLERTRKEQFFLKTRYPFEQFNIWLCTIKNKQKKM